MELGALVCVPNGAPLCDSCPLQAVCTAHKAGTQATLPVKTPLKARKTLDYTVALVINNDRVLLEQRAESGLLAGLWQPLLFEGTLTAKVLQQALAARGIACTIEKNAPHAKHIFTHLEWHMTGFFCNTDTSCTPVGTVWATRQEIVDVYTLPNAFKVYKKALEKYL